MQEPSAGVPRRKPKRRRWGPDEAEEADPSQQQPADINGADVRAAGAAAAKACKPKRTRWGPDDVQETCASQQPGSAETATAQVTSFLFLAQYLWKLHHTIMTVTGADSVYPRLGVCVRHVLDLACMSVHLC